MDREEALKLLRGGEEGIKEWNRRRMDSERVPDLLDAELKGCYLSRVNLWAVGLIGADLRGANLNGADLNWADLSYAKLSGAHLNVANLRSTDLIRADLHDAELGYAYLGGANLHGADLRGANLGWTTFAANDLSHTRGLESVMHIGPSTVGVDTLVKSKGAIPECFLRGCGVPQALIDHLPSLIASMQPIQFYSCFISHSSTDKAFTRKLHERLRAEGVNVYYAEESMRGGRRVDIQIEQAIRGCDRLLLVLSEQSMQSPWVRREIECAREKERQTGRNVLFPIGLVSFEKIRAWGCLDVDTGEDLGKKVREYHIPNFSKWTDENEFEKAFAGLMRDLRAEDEPPDSVGQAS